MGKVLRCKKAKTDRHVKPKVRSIKVPQTRLEHDHVDLVGLLPESEGSRYFPTMVDRTIRWAEATPLADIRAETIARGFIDAWIARFGVTATVISDR